MSTARTTFQTRFGNKAVLPVIHVEDAAQARRNVDIAREAGADGVWLINHDISSTALLPVLAEVIAEQAGWFVGTNLLDRYPHEAFTLLPAGCGGLWADNPGIDERTSEQPYAEQVSDAHVIADPSMHVLYFAGLDFKYQRKPDDLAKACKLVAHYSDVACTSGPGTGHAANIDRIAALVSHLDGHPLAIASGITPDNVHTYLPYIDAFLVATGISSSFTELDPAKTRALVEAVRGS